MLPLLQKCVDVYCTIYVKGGELIDNRLAGPENDFSGHVAQTIFRRGFCNFEPGYILLTHGMYQSNY